MRCFSHDRLCACGESMLMLVVETSSSQGGSPRYGVLGCRTLSDAADAGMTYHECCMRWVDLLDIQFRFSSTTGRHRVQLYYNSIRHLPYLSPQDSGSARPSHYLYSHQMSYIRLRPEKPQCIICISAASDSAAVRLESIPILSPAALCTMFPTSDPWAYDTFATTVTGRDPQVSKNLSSRHTNRATEAEAEGY
ncbi:hypothetical protein EX30DRAFT_123369 [Ascodesmis nigricans]|uniref:Uncharacterized protein n=1 Tax=Ascodesmis nigricans TaxID=341454 RepID=A0A4S2MPL2_9PEZI|nr:hypothetical protein EX30DRAFT_123369 [Ascodesmis nigricans]